MASNSQGSEAWKISCTKMIYKNSVEIKTTRVIDPQNCKKLDGLMDWWIEWVIDGLMDWSHHNNGLTQTRAQSNAVAVVLSFCPFASQSAWACELLPRWREGWHASPATLSDPAKGRHLQGMGWYAPWWSRLTFSHSCVYNGSTMFNHDTDSCTSTIWLHERHFYIQ